MTVALNTEPIQKNRGQKVRYAVVGLGWIAQTAVLPAFTNATENSELVALVSNDPIQCRELSQQYGVQRTYSYEDYDQCLNSGEIDAVYIALPNHLHCESTVRAANAGVHVLCEKPMAVTESECEAMIHACSVHNVQLMIAYRLHFEEANMQAVEIVQSGQLGEVRTFNSVLTQQVEQGNVRLLPIAKGGGPLYDLGIYCINAARYLFQEEPIEVFAVSANRREQRFSKVEEMTSAILRFPQERLATFTCSFGAAPILTYQIVGTLGDLRLDPAYGFDGELKHHLTIKGQTQSRTFAPRDQFAAQLLYFSDCIIRGEEPEPSGGEGLNDIRIIRALYQSMEMGHPVKVNHLEQRRRPTITQVKNCPVPPKPKLINAKDPSGNS